MFRVGGVPRGERRRRGPLFFRCLDHCHIVEGGGRLTQLARVMTSDHAAAFDVRGLNRSQQMAKQRLVPFGEYVPLEQWLRGLIEFFNLPMSFMSPGPEGQAPLQAGAFRVAPSICYEVVYPDLVARGARQADLLITISNDSWFGESLGPLQHLQMAKMRALENGRYLIRGTNNGISALVDHRGRVIAQTEQFVESSLSGEVEVMLGRTPFGSFGSGPIIIGSATVLLLMWLMYLGFWRDTQ